MPQKKVENYNDVAYIALHTQKPTVTQIRSWANAIRELYPNENTRLSYLSRLKRVVKTGKNFGTYSTAAKNAVEKYLYESSVSKRETYKQKVWDNQNAVQTISYEQAETLVSAIEKHANIFSLLLASGRRPSEILFADFEKSEKAGFVRVSGLSKKRAGMNDAIEIPIIGMTVEKFLQVLENYRLTADFERSEIATDKEQANKYLASRFNLAVRLSIPFETEITFTPKVLRALYAAYLAAKHQKGFTVEFEGKKMSVMAFYSRVLGHAEKDTQTAASYFAAIQIA